MNNCTASKTHFTRADKFGPGRQRHQSFLLWIRDCAIKSFHRRGGLSLVATTMLPLAARAANFTVDTLSDDDNAGLTLREAIVAANTTTDPDSIDFDPALSGILTLTQGELTISSDITITGPGQTLLTISGDADSSGDPSNGDSRIFNITSGNISLSELTLSNGDAESGAAILNNGSLTIVSSTFSENSADIFLGIGVREQQGGAISNYGSLTITNSIFSNNYAGNYGGGIYNSGSLTIINSSFSGNRAYDSAGGIRNKGSLSITNSSFLDNDADAGGGIHSGDGGGPPINSSLTIINSSFSNNSAFYGGGIYSDDPSANITNSSFSNNTAEDGGGIANYGTLTIVNSSFSGNYASFEGGGIRNKGSLSITNSSLSGNFARLNGGGIRNYSSLTITNSIIASNQSGSSNTDDLVSTTFGTVTTTGTNLFGTVGIGDSGDLIETNPANIFASLSDFTVRNSPTFQGGALADNGGPVPTILILEGGAAHNAGLNSALPADPQDLDGDGDLTEFLPLDARGLARIFDTTVDIGAVELADDNNNPAPFELVECALSTPTFDSAGSVILSFSLDPNAPSESSWILRRSLTLEDFDTVDSIFTFDGTSVTEEETGNSSAFDPTNNVFTITDVDPPTSGAFYRLEIE